MALQKQVIPIRIKSLSDKSPSELAEVGRIESAVNMMALKLTDGGVELRKRYGVTALTKNIEGGGTIGAGFKITSINGQLLVTDGNVLYAYSPTLNKWIKKGYVTDIAVSQTGLSTSNDTEAIGIATQLLDVDVAYLSGYLCYTVSRGNTAGYSGEWFVIDRASGLMVGNGPINGTSGALNARVVGVGTAFYVFYYNTANTIHCKKIDLATPDVISAASNVAVNVNTTIIFDVIADVTNTRILVAYRNTTPTLTIMVWNTNMTAGTSQAYATRDPNLCIGFLDAAAPLHVAVGTSAAGGLRCLTFNTSTLVVGTDTQVDAATDVAVCTGYFSGSRNVFYTRPGTATRYDVTWGWNESAAAFIAARSVSLHSRPFTTGVQGGAGKRFVLVGHDEDHAISPVGGGERVRTLLMMQLDQDGTTQSTVHVCGLLLKDNWGTYAYRSRGLGSAAVVSSTVAVVSAPSIVGPTVTQSGAMTFIANSFELDFSGTMTGQPVTYNGEVFFPGAAAKVYDGRNVFENGYYLRPDMAVLTKIVGGGTTTAGVTQFALVYSYIDSNGKLWRSSPSYISSITLNANDRISVDIPNLKLTDRNPSFAFSDMVNQITMIEMYQTKPNQNVFYLVNRLYNDPTADVQTITLSADAVATGEIIYTQSGALPNEYPPSVTAFCVHDSRLFAISGDKSLWYTRELENDEDMPAPSSLFRISFSGEFGNLNGLASMDSGLVISRKTRLHALTGQGPSKDGNGLYSYPVTLPAEVGFKTPNAYCNTPDGILFQTTSGMYLIDRNFTATSIPGIDDTIAGKGMTGAIALDDRPFAVFSDSIGQTAFVYDWEMGMWFMWIGGNLEFRAVSVTKCNAKLAFLKADGTVNQEVTGTWADNGSAYLTQISTPFIQVGDIFSNPRIYNVQLLLRCTSSFTLSAALSYDAETALDPTRTLAMTSSSRGVFKIPVVNRRAQSIKILLTDFHTVEGYRITGFGLEVGMKPGSRKQPVSKFLT